MRTFKLIEEYYGSPVLGTVIREDTNYQLVSEQVEIFQMYKVLKYPKHWKEFAEVDYTGVKFKCNNSDIIYDIIEKTFNVYTITWENETVQEKFKIFNVNECFESGEWTKIDETPKYFVGIDPATGIDSDFVTFRLLFGKMEQIFPDKKPGFELLSYIVEKPKMNGPITGKFEEIKIYKIKRLSDNQFFKIGDKIKLPIGDTVYEITKFNYKLTKYEELMVGLGDNICEVALSNLSNLIKI